MKIIGNGTEQKEISNFRIFFLAIFEMNPGKKQ